MVQLKGKKLPAIVGPTATGKTDLSLALAERLGKVELIYADSLAVYKYLDIGTDKPPASFRERVPHHLVDFLDPERDGVLSSLKKKRYISREKLESEGIFRLWWEGLLFTCRRFIGLFYLWELLLKIISALLSSVYLLKNSMPFCKCGPRRAQKIGKHDRKRLIRALEIFEKTGRPPSLS